MRIKITIYRLFLCSIILLSRKDEAYAQNQTLKRKDFLEQYIFKGNHSFLNFSPISFFRANLKNISGNYPVQSKAAPGLSIGLKYQLNFSNTHSLITGVDASLFGRNFIVSFDKNDFSPPLVKDYQINGYDSYSAVSVLSFPVVFQKRWLYNKTNHLFGEAGLKVNFSLGVDFETSRILLQNVNNGFYDVGGTYVVLNNDAKPWLSFPINAGHSWLLKNNNLLQLAFCSNLSFTKYVNGDYQIIIPGNPLTTGRYSSKGSFIGLSLNYVFTNANYRIRKAYEKLNKN